jgi:hypothetical protein
MIIQQNKTKRLKTIALLFVVAMLLMSRCSDNFEAPPIKMPVYSGTPENITVAEFREQYATRPSRTVIVEDYILRAVITGNDISGNIYKQIYIADDTGGINIGVDQNSIYTSNRVGQEVFIKLKGLASVIYGGELQIGYRGTYANRIPWEIYREHLFFNGFPESTSARARVVTIPQITAGMVNTLVELRDVSFVNPGANFTSNNAVTEEMIIDTNGNTLAVRTSSYCDFANDRLPSGKVTLVGILGRYDGAWQFTLRDRNDIRLSD